MTLITEFLNAPVLMNIGLLSVAILTVLAWLGWYKTPRLDLPRRRNTIGATGLAITTSLWVCAVLMIALQFVLSRIEGALWVVLSIVVLSRPLAIVAFFCAFALKKSSRWLGAAAAVVMFLCWPPAPIA